MPWACAWGTEAKGLGVPRRCWRPVGYLCRRARRLCWLAGTFSFTRALRCACARIGIAWRRKEGSIRPGLVTTTCTRYASSDKNELVRNITKGVGGRPGSATLVHLDSSDPESRAAFSVRVCDVVWAAYKNSKMHIVSGRMEY